MTTSDPAAPQKPTAPQDPTLPRGLTSEAAAARLRAEGPNELPQPDRRSQLRIALDVLREPMFSLLLGAGLVYLLIGELGDALLLLVFALISVAITIVQETRSERVLEALRDLTSPRALVIRDGERRRIAGREVVRGDLLVLAEGDRVPADGALLACQDLEIDESLLTGESLPVRKRAAEAADGPTCRPGGDDLPYVFSGTLVVRGQGLTEVRTTGIRSEIGRIGKALGGIEREPPVLKAQTDRLVRILAAFGLGVSAVSVLLYGLYRGSWLDGVLGGIALSMSMLPEEFPLVLTVFMVMGAWRISQARVLTRRASAIEALGAATVLCTDKTGTLTLNRMTVAELQVGAQVLRPAETAAAEFPAAFRDLAVTARLASAPEPFDPMEKAIQALLPEAENDRRILRRTYGLRPELLAVTQVWQEAGGGDLLVASKGAPEAIARLCRLDPAALHAMHRAVDRMADAGIRVLGVASARSADGILPDSAGDFAFTFLGLLGFADPLRPNVPAAVRECRTAGIRVVMVTGDYPATAAAIARQAGLEVVDLATGAEIEAMNDAELAARIRRTTIFARILPEQKLRIVNALKADGEVLAMTGDGVNDAPALKAAHIGIAMGGRGADVAREAASIVLLDDDFGSIVRTIRLGRRIYDNLRKAMGYILAVHVPIAGLSLLPLLFGWPLILAPVHIAFLEMVIDPVCSIVFEAEEAEEDIMRRRPRRPSSPLLSGGLIRWSLFQGALVLVLLAAIHVGALRLGMPENEARTLTFVSLVATNIGLILVNRSFSTSLLAAFRRPNPALWRVIAATAALLALALAWPPASSLFRFGPLHAGDLGICLGAGFAVLAGLELVKRLWRNLLIQ